MRQGILILFLLVCVQPTQAVDDLLMKGRVLILGDSITHAGGWVTCLAQQLARHHGRLPDVIAIGLASETASGLSEKDHPFKRPSVHQRLARALELVEPQVVIACYGMNDGIYWPLDDSRMQAFKDGIGKLISDCRAAGAQVILLTPPPFDPQPIRAKLRPAGAADYGFKNPYEGYAGVLEVFARWQLTLPAEQARTIDLNGPMSAYVAKQRQTQAQFTMSGDGIHPNDQGHLLMADCVLRGLGYPGVGDDLAAAFATIKTDPLYVQIKRWREQRSDGWRDYVGFTRGKTVKRDTIADIEEQVTTLRTAIEAALTTK